MESAIAIWNIRGLNDPRKQKEVYNIVQSEKLDLIGLTETKVKSYNYDVIHKNMLPQWSQVSNKDHDHRGRIWLLWNHRNIDVVIEQMTDQYIHTTIKELGTKRTYLLTVVYGRNGRPDRVKLWDDLSVISQSVTTPWTLMGDFNACKDTCEKIGGNPLHPRETIDFNEFLVNNDLADLSSKGAFYTWSNKSRTNARTLTKID
ncbi:hypothetical protein FRX31_032018, partial [Thalictrum thalictroides]